MNYPVRTLTRSREHRMIAGVIGGLAEYSGRSPALLRVLFVFLSLASAAFPGTVVYLLLWAVLPKAPRRPPFRRTERTERTARTTRANVWDYDPSLDLPDS